MIIVGDIHGRIEEFLKIGKKNLEHLVIGLGDMGFKEQYDYFLKFRAENTFILMGNHDYYPYLESQDKNGYYQDSVFKKGILTDYDFGGLMYIEDDFSVNNDHKIGYCRGAFSRDKNTRTLGVDYFPEEELNYRETLKFLDYYQYNKPEIMLSHDCPKVVFQEFSYEPDSQMPEVLQQAFEIHKPKIWIFGHHHKSIDVGIEGTRFVCLPEMTTFKLTKNNFLL